MKNRQLAGIAPALLSKIQNTTEKDAGIENMTAGTPTIAFSAWPMLTAGVLDMKRGEPFRHRHKLKLTKSARSTGCKKAEDVGKDFAV